MGSLDQLIGLSPDLRRFSKRTRFTRIILETFWTMEIKMVLTIMVYDNIHICAYIEIQKMILNNTEESI